MNPLSAYRNRHTGETVVVCGCGRSLNELPRDYAGITIGVNDVGRRFDPTYLVVLNPRSQFRGERFRYVAASRAEAVFTQLELGIARLPVVRIKLGERGGTSLDSDTRLPYTRNSTYVAACLALFMGARRVGLIGVDFTDDHFFGTTGPHSLSGELPAINREYAALAEAARRMGAELVNLSATSKVTSLPYCELERFLRGGRQGERAAPRQAGLQGGASGQHRGMVAVQRYGIEIVDDFLDRLANTAASIGYGVVREVNAVAAREQVIKVVWNGRSFNGKGPVLFCEHGWLPRWSYQISWQGINASSHLAPFAWDGIPLNPAQHGELSSHLAGIRARGPGRDQYMQTEVEAATSTPERFILVPLQIEGDTNIRRHVPQHLRRMQALVDAVSRADPPLPVIYKQHPADVAKGNQHLRLRLQRPQDLLWSHDRGNIHALLKAGACRGIVSLNSNVVHDGLVWDVPSVVLGRNIWPEGENGPFLTRLPRDWNELFGLWAVPERRACRDAYAYYLMRHQWSLDDAGDGEKVAQLLGAVDWAAARRSPVVAGMRPSDVPLVNVVAENRGWLFEDLKGLFAAASGPRARVIASERARTDADVWIYLRAREAARTPRPERTVVQIHDLLDGGRYRPGGERQCVAECGGVLFTHPGQVEIVTAAGIDLSTMRSRVLPVGATESFALRSRLPERFTVGWIGRPVIHEGCDLARLEWFVECAVRLGRGVQVVLLGERMERQAAFLRKAGIDCRYLHRREWPMTRHPEAYAALDCVAITAATDMGAVSLFEGLAAGVPVVSTPVGWATELVRDGVNGFVVDSVDAMVAAVERVRATREAWFERRAEIRASIGDYTMEAWVQENIRLALELLPREVCVRERAFG